MQGKNEEEVRREMCSFGIVCAVCNGLGGVLRSVVLLTREKIRIWSFRKCAVTMNR